jgi:hypothetical protein
LFLAASLLSDNFSRRSLHRTDLIPLADMRFLPLPLHLGSVLLPSYCFSGSCSY